MLVSREIFERKRQKVGIIDALCEPPGEQFFPSFRGGVSFDLFYPPPLYEAAVSSG